MMCDDDSSVSRLRFPQKLWHLMKTRDDAILWGSNGRTILLNYNVLDRYLRCNQSIFKTIQISSFIRQLNLYGFRKVTSHSQDPLCNSNNPHLHEYMHEYFQFGKAELLPIIKRKPWNTRSQNTQILVHKISSCYMSDAVLEARKAFKIALKKAIFRPKNNCKSYINSSDEASEQENVTEETCESEIIEDFRHCDVGEKQDVGYRFSGESFEVYQDEPVCDDTHDLQSSSNMEDSSIYNTNNNIIIEVLDETDSNMPAEEIVTENQFAENIENNGGQFFFKGGDSGYESYIVEESYIDVTDEKYDFEKECIENAAMYAHQEVGAPWEYGDTVTINESHDVEGAIAENENSTTNEWKELYSQFSSTMDLLQS